MTPDQERVDTDLAYFLLFGSPNDQTVAALSPDVVTTALSMQTSSISNTIRLLSLLSNAFPLNHQEGLLMEYSGSMLNEFTSDGAGSFTLLFEHAFGLSPLRKKYPHLHVLLRHVVSRHSLSLLPFRFTYPQLAAVLSGTAKMHTYSVMQINIGSDGKIVAIDMRIGAEPKQKPLRQAMWVRIHVPCVFGPIFQIFAALLRLPKL